ncbi:aminopeptidase [Caballeronia terrestris]|uniref:Aminopeptidase n=1 Tax=Caballeronia terrestris TaxID=1226301 RepID=A0A158J4S3_9BURK|nr:P1 family peptidase [Caballeronia terrestris]SAL63310.1 aminopeptidase [Caballeronia terrestris]
MIEAPYIGSLKAGPLGTIADVAGVTVGHCTLDQRAVQTGVTVIRPHQGDVYRSKVPAAASVINGFGKSIGLVQVDELGVLETPIALTNTFGVGTVANAQIRHAIEANSSIGREWPTVNPLVFECNDGYLNDIQALAVQEAHFVRALQACGEEFERGSVGAGRGMSCFELKGGIGSASRVSDVAGRSFTTGALVLANFGRLSMLTLGGVALGRTLSAAEGHKAEKGSIIMIIATDAPLDARQLRRLSMRATAGLARTGSVYGHGSGDLSLAFTTAYTVPHLDDFIEVPALVSDSRLDPLFQAAADSVEQAIVDALFSAVSVTGRDGHRRLSIKDITTS